MPLIDNRASAPQVPRAIRLLALAMGQRGRGDHLDRRPDDCFSRRVGVRRRPACAYGLPPFSALVLLLAACRDNWRGESSRLSGVVGLVAMLERREFPAWLGELFLRLDAVHALPAELRTTPAAKADLAKVVFEECSIRTSPPTSATVVRSIACC